MRIEEITVAQNGFVLVDDHGKAYITKTLTEAAQLVGELPSMQVGVVYAPGYNADRLRDARREAQIGNRIAAIKILRDAFSQRLGLKEAKELVEVLICNQ